MQSLASLYSVRGYESHVFDRLCVLINNLRSFLFA